MKCEVIVIKNLIKQNKLDLAIQELMDYADKTGANNIVVNHYWSQQKLQQLIEEQCKDEYMHWITVYDSISHIETLKAPWFYRDELGNFYNINEMILELTLKKIENNIKSA